MEISIIHLSQVINLKKTKSRRKSHKLQSKRLMVKKIKKKVRKMHNMIKVIYLMSKSGNTMANFTIICYQHAQLYHSSTQPMVKLCKINSHNKTLLIQSRQQKLTLLERALHILHEWIFSK